MKTWSLRQLEPTAISVGPCAWHVSLLADDPEYVRRRPTLVVVYPDDDDAMLEKAAAHLGDLPVLLVVSQPRFARRLEQTIRDRIDVLGLCAVAAAGVMVDDWMDVKGGGTTQVLTRLRQHGLIEHVALGHADALGVEWLAQNTTARCLLVDYSANNQQAAYRATDAARSHGMCCVASRCTSPDAQSEGFALAEAGRVLPVFDRRLDDAVGPFSAAQLASAQEAYRLDHREPPPLPRSVPPGSS